MSPSIFINAKNIFLHQLPPTQVGEFVELKVANGFEPKRETRDLGNGERITQKEALAELAKLGDGWHLETPHELFAQVDYGHKNQHGAYSRDESLKDGYYWTSQETPWYEGGRVVVGFDDGNVDYYLDDLRAFARAVRVSGQ